MKVQENHTPNFYPVNRLCQIKYIELIFQLTISDSKMRKGKFFEQGDEGNSDEDQEPLSENYEKGDFLDWDYATSREFWIKVKTQGNPDNSKFE